MPYQGTLRFLQAHLWFVRMVRVNAMFSPRFPILEPILVWSVKKLSCEPGMSPEGNRR